MNLLQDYLDQWKAPSRNKAKKTLLGQYLADYSDSSTWTFPTEGEDINEGDDSGANSD